MPRVRRTSRAASATNRNPQRSPNAGESSPDEVKSRTEKKDRIIAEMDAARVTRR
jgi:hypothetical protein